MLLADMVEMPIDAALEDREIAFDRVCVPEAAANVFLDRMVDGAVAVEVLSDRGIDGALIGHEVGLAVNLSFEDRLQGRGVHGRDVLRSHAPSRSTSATTGSLPFRPAFPPGAWTCACCFLAADIGFVSLDDCSVRQAGLPALLAQALADAMANEPSRLLGKAEHAANLARSCLSLTPSGVRRASHLLSGICCARKACRL